MTVHVREYHTECTCYTVRSAHSDAADPLGRRRNACDLDIRAINKLGRLWSNLLRPSISEKKVLLLTRINCLKILLLHNLISVEGVIFQK